MCVHVTTCLCVPLPYVSLPAVLRPAPRVIDYPPRLARALHTQFRASTAAATGTARAIPKCGDCPRMTPMTPISFPTFGSGSFEAGESAGASSPGSRTQRGDV